MQPSPNDSTSESIPGIQYIGNFHKTLPHNEYGEVDPAAYIEFEKACTDLDAGATVDFDVIPRGFDKSPFPSFAIQNEVQLESGAPFVNPMAGAATEILGLAPKDGVMVVPPSIHSISAAAEMVELYWMALLRDKPLEAFDARDTDIEAATSDIRKSFQKALDEDKEDGALKLTIDLPSNSNGGLRLDAQTLFRLGLRDEEHGPLISQFFIRDIPFGVQTIDQKQTPYAMGKDFLTNKNDWLRAQITGKDKYGRGYGDCNNYQDQQNHKEIYYETKPRYISTMRDLARFVNRDALHQAYFNAALFLDAIGAELDQGNPYKNGTYSKQIGFATLGGPDLLTLVSEVASRALKVVWRQKWLVHRRARPEVYGGLLEMQQHHERHYGLIPLAIESEAGKRIFSKNKNYFLPMAFSAGSPVHPAYGAGHATVAGACVTILKAWFNEDQALGQAIINAEKHKEPGKFQYLLKPGKANNGIFENPTEYDRGDTEAAKMTVGGELNKLASNVAMGRSMGGVHWRSDNTRSLRLGEQVAIEILKKRVQEYAERDVSFTFRSFDGQNIKVDVNGANPAP